MAHQTPEWRAIPPTRTDKRGKRGQGVYEVLSSHSGAAAAGQSPRPDPWIEEDQWLAGVPSQGKCSSIWWAEFRH